jgi:phosphoribosyl-AMP cyclohydrolase
MPPAPLTLPADFSPEFAKSGGVIPVIAQCARTLDVLMLAYMNEEALALTCGTGEAHYWSRSRGRLWRKGESSGHVQKVRAIRLDCDNDTLLILVDQLGEAACHTGRRSCFYRELRDGAVSLCSPLIFDPKEVYK